MALVGVEKVADPWFGQSTAGRLQVLINNSTHVNVCGIIIVSLEHIAMVQQRGEPL